MGDATPLFQWYRFESRSTKTSILSFPFDLVYFIPEYHAQEFGRVYDVFLAFKMSVSLQLAISKRLLSEYHVTGMRREDSKSVRFERYTKDESRALLSAVSQRAGEDILSKKALMCVPVLPRRVGDQVKPAYFLNRDMLSLITSRHAEQTKNDKVSTPYEIESVLYDSTLYANGKPCLPCAICLNSVKKVVNDAHCTLGTVSCLSKIKLVGVDTFQEKSGVAVTPADYQETHNGTGL